MSNMGVPGQYKVTYTATDSSGNESTLERLVDVLDREKPNILGDSTLSRYFSSMRFLMLLPRVAFNTTMIPGKP